MLFGILVTCLDLRCDHAHIAGFFLEDLENFQTLAVGEDFQVFRELHEVIGNLFEHNGFGGILLIPGHPDPISYIECS